MANQLFDNQIPFMKPWLGDEEWNSLREIINSGWVSQGPKVKEFEDLVADYLGVKYAVATNACTSAMHLALRIAGVKYGDEVILCDSTCMANVNAVIMAGAIPVFVDADARTFNIDPTLIEQKITAKTKAVMNIDQIGLPNDLDAIQEICNKHNLFLLDDAATAFGATYKGKKLGGNGVVSTFSFHPRKMITTGEGGMLVTNDADFSEKARILRSAGASISDLERHKAKGTMLQKYFENGYNYRMTDMQAAIGIVQMKKVNAILEQRTEQAIFYNEKFNSNEKIKTPFVPNYATHAWSSYCIKITEASKKRVPEIIQEMTDKKIGVRYGIQPLHQEPYFDSIDFKDEDYPVSCDIAENAMFLPIFPGLKQTERAYVVDTLLNILQ